MTESTNKSTPPPPLDDPMATDPLECPPLRWGMLGCGRVSHDFVLALHHLSTAQVVACAARELDRAQEFASKHGITQAYGSYEELATDPNVDIVYVGNIHIFRRSIGELCLNHNKHVLLEKPVACNAEDAKYLVALARSKNLFLMEGMWTRFFPAVEQARLIQKQELGEVVSVLSDFHFAASDSEEYPSSFLYNWALGGGASYLVSPYPIAAATLFFEQDPDKIHTVGHVDTQTGADLQAAMILSFPATGDKSPAQSNSEGKGSPKLPGAGIATLTFGMLGESEEETSVICTNGRLTIKAPCHCPTKLVVSSKNKGRGNTTETTYHYPLPEDSPELLEKVGGYFYPNSAGFCYEAAAVARCIAAGKLEAPQYTHAEMLRGIGILDQARAQLGLADPTKKEEI
ncbi:hypothetical protein ACA910_001726 [Epithemia clementina (nom. ined.)]